MTQETIQPFLDWISAHPTWSGFFVFLISLSESLAIVGLIVPGVVMMTAIGGMMGAGTLPFWETLLWAILGAIVGDGISYWLGHHYHDRLRLFWPFKQFPKLFARGEDFFKNHGGKSIVLGRFVGPVRPMIPVIAGMMDMTPKRFLFFNILSALAWAPLYCLPGILIGASLGNLSSEVAARAGLFILLSLLALWLVYEGLALMGASMVNLIKKSIRKACKLVKKAPYSKRLLKSKLGSEEGQLALIFLFLISTASFLFTTFDILSSEGISEWNEPVYQVLRALYSEKLIALSGFLTGIADPWVLLPTAFIVGMVLLWKNHVKTAAYWLGTLGLGLALEHYLKIGTAIARPEGLLYHSKQFSYPSGHTLLATLTFGFIAALLQPSLPRQYRWAPWAIAIPLILFLSLTRVYLGIHWFTDMVGGLTLGIALLSLGVFLYRRTESKAVPLKRLLVPALLSHALLLTLYTAYTYPTVRQELVRQWPSYELSEAKWWQGDTESDALYRTGAFKHHATIFDIQWLGSLNPIQKHLEKGGWKVASPLNFKTGVLLLANNPDPIHFPIMPKFHRDRLPVLTMVKSDEPSKRLVLQVWQSDYKADKGDLSLWVGTLREETVTHPLPLITYFAESSYRPDLIRSFMGSLQAPDVQIKKLTLKKPIARTILLMLSS